MKHRKTFAVLGIAAALGMSSCPVAFAGPVAYEHGPNLVANGGFESGDFTGWTAAIGPFSGIDPVAAHSGGFGVFGGDADVPGTVSQIIATSAGSSYNIHFWLRSDGQEPNQFYVQWGGATVFDSSNLGAFDYQEFVIDPIAAGASTELVIGFRNDFGFLEFDDVSVFAVPEPFSLALLGVGLLGLGWTRRRAGPRRLAQSR